MVTIETFKTMKAVKSLIVIGIILIMTSCDSHHYSTINIRNNTDYDVHLLFYSSKTIIHNVGDSISIPLYLPNIDSIYIAPLDLYSVNRGGIGHPCCYNYGFGETFVMDIIYKTRTYNDSINFSYKTIDSMIVKFGNEKYLCFPFDNKRYFLEQIDEIWSVLGRYEEFSDSKNKCDCTFTYFITDEMYNQAVPIQ